MADMHEMPECPPPAPQYLSLIKCRSRWESYDRYRFHYNIGHAKNAVGQTGGAGKIWQWSEWSQGWILLYEVEAHTPTDKLPWNAEKTKAREDAAERAARDALKKRAQDYVNEVNNL